MDVSTTADHRHDRVRARSARSVNDRIDALARARLAEAVAGGSEAIVARLAELDREWNIDRAVTVFFTLLGSLAHELGHRSRGWRNFFRVQLGLLFLHHTWGWCPPTSLFRRLGFRTQKEIDAERQVLLAQLR